VGIKGDRIVAVGKLARNDASNIIDARGLIVPKIARVSFLPFFRSV
jgi:dihydroorotase-like cyclic amidohydrolase